MARIAPCQYTNHRKKRRIRRGFAMIGTVVIALGLALWLVAASCAGMVGTAGKSTPRSEWRSGETPFLYQTDPQWASHPYAEGTVEKNGCGPTCLSMVYVALTGRDDLDPAAMADFSERNGYTRSCPPAQPPCERRFSQGGPSSAAWGQETSPPRATSSCWQA